MKEQYKFITLLIILCLCFIFTGCKNNIQSSQDEWICTCGIVNTGNFCGICGSAKSIWACSCGTVNTTKFCTNCGKQKENQQGNQQEYQQENQQANKPEQKQENKQKQEQKQAINFNLLKDAKVGDYVKFGNYPQNAKGEEQPIEWQILAKEGNNMLFISRYALEAKCFDNDSNNWKNSEIRSWLNGDFYNKAFNEKEKKYIKSSNLSDVGTTDNVFLLSAKEAKKYFVNDEMRKCTATDYAKKNSDWLDDDNYSWWWLRSLDSNYGNVVCLVGRTGNVSSSDVSFEIFVRPALWINI